VEVGLLGNGLTSFQRRLVHQTVEIEYPTLASRSQGTYMQITKKNKDVDAARQAAHKQRFDVDITEQVGIRWIFEALAGGDLSMLTSILSPTENDRSSTQELLSTLQAKLQKKRPALVGHNLFTDLIYLHNQFFDPIAESLDGFSKQIRSLFPRFVFNILYL
jgi:hypothetical protein